MSEEEKLEKFKRLHEWIDECLDNIGRAQAQLSLDIERVQQAIAAAEGAQTEKGDRAIVPLCEPCLASDVLKDNVARKFLNAPDFKIIRGGKATTEQVLAIADKQDATEN